MSWHPEKPYNTLPILPPNVELETNAVLKRCISARAALAELKQVAELIPNQTMLINTLPLLEANVNFNKLGGRTEVCLLQWGDVMQMDAVATKGCARPPDRTAHTPHARS